MLFLSERLRDPRIPGKILFNEDENAHLPPHWHTMWKSATSFRAAF